MLVDAGAGQCSVAGDLTLATAATLWQQLQSTRLLRSATSVDLGQVKDSDSAGLALLIAWRASCKANGGELQVTSPPQRLSALARLTDAEGMLLRLVGLGLVGLGGRRIFLEDLHFFVLGRAIRDLVLAALQVGIADEHIRVIRALQHVVSGQQRGALVDLFKCPQAIAHPGVVDVGLGVDKLVANQANRIAH